MSLDIYMECPHCNSTIYEANITHNLNVMAKSCELYAVMYRPDENGVERAEQAEPLLRSGIEAMVRDKTELEKLNPSNGWGSYTDLLNVATGYLEACSENPTARIRVSR
jgi:ABC-type dipeptide/oligopeptide/nickel transport system ATPase component